MSDAWKEMVKARGRLSDDHLDLVKRVCADVSNPIAYRRLMWSTTKSALELTGRDAAVLGAEPKEQEQSK